MEEKQIRDGSRPVAEGVVSARRAGGSPDPMGEVRAFYRFHVRLTLLYGGTVFVTLALMAFIFHHLWVGAERAALQQRLLAMASSLAETIDAEAILQFPVEYEETSDTHRKLLKQFERVAKQDADVETIYILRPTEVPTQLRFFVDYAKDGNHGKPGELYAAADTPVLLRGFEHPVVEDRPYEDIYGLTLSGYAPLKGSGGQCVGLVGLDVQVARLQVIRDRVLTASLGVVSASFLVISLVSGVVARSIRQPLSRLLSATSAVANGDLDTRLHLQRRDEFGVLGRHFDHMAAGLKERKILRDLFGCYVSEDVARALLQSGELPELGGEEVVVTVLFCDVRNYSTISERLSPTQMVGLLNQYLEAMNAIIDQYHGCVIEFLGDGIFAVFGAPNPFNAHAERGARCAMEMRERLAELNDGWEQSGLAHRWQELGIDKIECRIGLHSGPVVAGNLGSQARMKYSVIGDTVNVAARLEALNKDLGTSILISQEVRSRLPPGLADQTHPTGSVNVKGRNGKVETYSLYTP